MRKKTFLLLNLQTITPKVICGSVTEDTYQRHGRLRSGIRIVTYAQVSIANVKQK